MKMSAFLPRERRWASTKVYGGLAHKVLVVLAYFHYFEINFFRNTQFICSL
jgi:hypothetical protein